MRRLVLALGVLAWLAAGVTAMLAVDRPLVRMLGALVLVVGVVALLAGSQAARASLADRFGPLGPLAGGLFALRRAALLATAGAAVAALVLAEVLERALEPEADLAGHLAAHHRPLGELRTPSGDTARAYAADQPPLQAAARLDHALPAEDQRYTPAGVFLRYEDAIVGLLPDGGRTRIVLEDDEAGLRHFGAYVGDFWGPRYDDDAGVPESAKAVPDERDAERLVEQLRRAEDVHDVCYGWDVRILSGRRRGRSQGSSVRGAGRRLERTDCADWVQLEGLLDPLAGRFSRSGEPGEFALGLAWHLDQQIRLSAQAFTALSVPENEMIRGATTEPTGQGERAGKGLIEYVGALPLIVEQAAGLPSIPLEFRAARSGPLTPTDRSDAERRADADRRGLPPALLRAAGVCALLMLLVIVPAGAVRRLLRR